VRVGVDGRSLEGGPARGVGTYTRLLIDALREGFPEDEVVVFGRRPRAVYAAGAVLGRPRLGGAAAPCDVLLLPTPAPVATGGVPYVLTVHDRSWETRPQDFRAYERFFHRLARPRRLARGAARVIADTLVGAEDLRRAWGVEAAVVPLAARPLPAPGVPPERPYVLFVGALEPRKAPDLVAAAMPPGLDLRVAGAGRIEIPGAIVEGWVDDARLATLYAGAQVLAVPSLEEGFGLPAVEALAHGTPVVASDIPVHREVLGDRATLVPVGDVQAWRTALAHATEGTDPFVARTWADVARETHVVLAEAAGA
jgi:glycosyltransferase involved in cell wall biosynthesis